MGLHLPQILLNGVEVCHQAMCSRQAELLRQPNPMVTEVSVKPGCLHTRMVWHPNSSCCAGQFGRANTRCRNTPGM